ncbi:MAG TPA: AmmeMemoRadiSam system radical SAM enzyme [Candidatus Omnitrophota bacterium]|nr:AmmeMemoRadiSam system radical SAM enzyme [Candidatus Omnitrophota bacterium]
MSESITRLEFLKKAAAITGAVIAGPALSGTVSSLISLYPPPKTLSRLPGETNPLLREALWWESACAGVQCTLCPFRCFLPEGMRGLCNVRVNNSGRLMTLVYAQPVAVHVDPIEKKPVYHLYPGSRAFSISTVGCNLRCAFCQNWEISQSLPEQAEGKPMSPEEVVRGAVLTRSASIAYTYGEPTVFYEYMLDTMKLAKRQNIRNVVISAGYINEKPLRGLAPFIDVMKVDLKGFNEKFYRRVVKGELRFVLNTLVLLAKLGILTEVVNLVVPTLNDHPDEIRKMCQWIRRELGPDTPVFFSRFTPQYQLSNLPPTLPETLRRAREIGMEEGLHYVYSGNNPGDPGENTYCPTCHKPLIERYGYAVIANRLKPGGYCPYDNTKIPGIWR